MTLSDGRDRDQGGRLDGRLKVLQCARKPAEPERPCSWAPAGADGRGHGPLGPGNGWVGSAKRI